MCYFLELVLCTRRSEHVQVLHKSIRNLTTSTPEKYGARVTVTCDQAVLPCRNGKCQKDKNAWLSMILGCTTHTVLTLNISVLLARAWFRALDWKRRTNAFMNFHQLSLTQEVDLRIEGVKFPVGYSPIMAYTERLRPKKKIQVYERVYISLVEV